MKLKSIPPQTCITLLRKKNYARDWNKRNKVDAPLLSGKRGRMRPQMSRKPLEEKLAKWQGELDELSQWADEGLDVSKVKKSIEERIKGLLDLLEGK